MAEPLPQLAGDRLFIGDGGLETSLIFHQGLELPDFAAFTLLADDAGREAIRAYFDDVFARAMTHEVDTVAISGDSAGFSVRCAYPDGTLVVCVATAQLRDGAIERQLTAQAWDSAS